MGLAEQRPRPVEEYEIEILDDEAVLLHPVRSSIVHLNRSATIVYRLCDGERTVADIASLVAAAYPTAADDIRGDVERTIDSLARAGAVTLQQPPSNGPVES